MNRCDNCGGDLSRDGHHNGVGMEYYGPASCSSCGWYEGIEIDMMIDAERDHEQARDEWFLMLQDAGGES